MDCKTCELKEGAKVIFRNDYVFAVVPDKPSSAFVEVFPVKHVSSLSTLDQKTSAYLFSLANYASMLLFEILKYEGSNIIVYEGDHIRVAVVMRKMNDGLSFEWQPKSFSSSEIDQVEASIKSLLEVIPEEKKTMGSVHKEELINDEKNYLIKQFDRIP